MVKPRLPSYTPILAPMATSPFLASSPLSSLPKPLTLKPRTLNPQILDLKPQTKTLTLKHQALTLARRHRLAASGGVAAADLVEKDWSFLDAAGDFSRALAAGELTRASRVLAVMPTAAFVDALMASYSDEAPCELAVAAHESLLVLAGIKEEHDEVRCFHAGGGGGDGGVVEAVPERFDAFDAVFVCYFPGMGVSAGALLRALQKRCSKGARLVIFLDQGRQIMEQHRRQYPENVKSDLPDKATLEKAAADNNYQITEFVDDSTLYLSVFRFCG